MNADCERFLSNAMDFKCAAELLLKHSGSPENPNLAVPASIIVLTGYAWEFGFKALLSKNGISNDELKNFGHRLKDLRDEAKEYGVTLKQLVEDAKSSAVSLEENPNRAVLIKNAVEHFESIAELTGPETNYAARYPSKMECIPWPEFQFEMIDQLFAYVKGESFDGQWPV